MSLCGQEETGYGRPIHSFLLKSKYEVYINNKLSGKHSAPLLEIHALLILKVQIVAGAFFKFVFLGFLSHKRSKCSRKSCPNVCWLDALSVSN